MNNFSPLMPKRNSMIIRIIALILPVFCLVSILAPTVFAQNTYVITDGNQVTVHTTYASDPAKVLSEAGFALDADDFYTTQETDGVSEITVQRAQVITINNCGKILQVNSYGETVEALLSRLGISATGEYSVSQNLDAETYDGMEMAVVHTVHAQETYTVELPFETVYCEDPTLPEGQENILVAGVAGQAMRKADVVYVNTNEQSRTVLEETVLEQPVNQIVAVGTGENVGGTNSKPLIGDGVIVLPTGEVLTYTSAQQFVATAYTHTDEGCNMTTATGTTVRWGTVAVDPDLIPYGTRMYIVTNDGSYIYGVGTAEDCGGAIQGNRLDLYFPTDPECWAFGVRNCTVYFLGDANWRV